MKLDARNFSYTPKLRRRSNDVSVDPWLSTEEEKSKKASEKPENLLSTKEHLRFLKLRLSKQKLNKKKEKKKQSKATYLRSEGFLIGRSEPNIFLYYKSQVLMIYFSETPKGNCISLLMDILKYDV